MAIIVINFKTYAEATGQRAVRLAKICEKVAKKTNTKIIIAVQNVDLFRVSSAVSIPVFAEHIDPVGYGANTGKDLPEAILENGAAGVLINHSEDRAQLSEIHDDIKRARNIGLATIVCAPSAESSEATAALDPDFIAVEPPELIGGDVSVSKAKPGLITETVKLVRRVNKRVPVLCGAGIKERDDVRIAMKLGCEGILVASGVTKAKDPEAALLDLIKGMKMIKLTSSAAANHAKRATVKYSHRQGGCFKTSRLEGFYFVKEPIRGRSITAKRTTSGAWRGTAKSKNKK
jgi:triosephosphate isomerase